MGERRISPEIMQEILKDERFNVLRAVVDVRGNPVGTWVADELFFKRERQMGVFMGPPAVGKTSKLDSTVELLGEYARLFGRSIDVGVVKYEDVLAKVEEEYGEPVKEDIRFNGIMLMAIRNPEKRFHFGPEMQENKHVTLVELVGVGAKSPKDRAVSANEFLMVEAHSKLPVNTVWDCSFSDNQIQVRAVQSRFDVLHEERLDRIFSIVEAYKYKLPEEFGHDENSGRIIKEAISRMATSKHITNINWEILHLVSLWVSTQRDEIDLPRKYGVELPSFINFNAGAYGLRQVKGESRSTHLLLFAAYYLNQFKNLGLSEEDAKVTFVPFLKDQTIYWDPRI